MTRIFAALSAMLVLSACAPHMAPAAAPFAAALGAKPEEIAKPRCSGYAEEPTEFSCAYRRRTPEGRWEHWRAMIAIDGDHYVLIDDPEPPIAYGCGDLVVVGRVENLGFDTIATKDEDRGDDLVPLDWTGRITMRVHVQRRLRGAWRGEVLKAQTVAHTYIRDDRDFVLVLRQQTRDRYVLVALHYMDVPLRVADRCEPGYEGAWLRGAQD